MVIQQFYALLSAHHSKCTLLSCTSYGEKASWCNHCGIVWRYLKKLKIELPYDPLSTTGYLSKEYENTSSKRYMHPMFIAALFPIAKLWIKMWCIHTHTHTHTHTMEYYSAIKKNEMLSFATM